MELDFVNEKDEVIGKAPIDEIYDKKLWHRIVHIFVFNSKGEMALKLRSRQKKFLPLYWSAPVGGHVLAGETYEKAALRELQEELGIKAKIKLIGKDFYENERGLKKFMAAFKTDFNGSFKINPEEVERVEYFTPDKIKAMIAAGEKFHSELLFLLKKHF
jgi:16S rRNA (adenine1518-N6/adenine1519-N6)-dimethyltransferase